MMATPRLRRLRRLGRALRKGVLRGLGAITVILGLVLLGRGTLAQLAAFRTGPGEGLLLGVTSALLLYKILEHLRLLPRARTSPSSQEDRLPPLSKAQRDRLQLESGAALCVATFFVLQALGGARSPLHPLVYALVAFLSIQHRTRNLAVLLGLVLLCEALLLRGDGLLTAEPVRLLVHGLFIALFAVLHLLFFKGEMLRQRGDYDRRIGAEIQRMREEAVDFRLLSAGPARPARPLAETGVARSRAEEEVILAQSAVVVIRQSMRLLIALLRRSLGLHTCVLLWPARGGEVLRVQEGCTAEGVILEEEMAADKGALGTIIKSRTLLNLPSPKPGHLPYYRVDGRPRGDAEEIGAFVGVPMLEQDSGQPLDRVPGQLCGVLCCDRREPFTAEEVALIQGVADQLLRSVQSERVFAAVERRKYEHERLYSASEKLNRALTLEQVHATAFSAVQEICEFDFAAIVSYDRQARRHAVVALAPNGDGQPAGELRDLSFPDNAGLCAMAVKNRTALPQDGVLREKETPIFDEKVRLRGMESLLVLPLICAGEPVGTLVCAGRRPRGFSRDKREMLGVIANQVAVSLENARMYQAMEAMATTDGLTGLTNRRAFQERFTQMLQRAERQGKSLTLLMTDVDHFKKVNDTYGHPVGDVVLKRVAQVVQSCVRKIDIAARYGGEEFAVVLEANDREGGRQLAERVRQEVQRLWFHSDKGPFQCTLSLGVATFPLDGRDVKTLTAHADQALYHAKHGGRNQTVAYDDMRERLTA